MDMRVGLYPLTGEPGCGSGGTGTAWKSGNSGSRLQAVYNQGHASVVVLLLADERLDPNIANQDGNTALTCAAVNGDTSVVKLLLADEPTTLFSSSSLVPLLPGPQHHRAKRRLVGKFRFRIRVYVTSLPRRKRARKRNPK